jgi:hypothetical protein
MKSPDTSENHLREGLRALASEVEVEGDVESTFQRSRLRRRRRTIRGAAAALALLAVSGGLIGWFASGIDNSTEHRASPPSAVAGASCEVVNDGVPVFQGFAEGTSPSAASGEEVTINGSGLYSPAEKVEVWWNLDRPDLPQPGESSAQGSDEGFLAATGPIDFGCTFEVSFPVPNAAPGEYPVVVRLYDPNSSFYLESEYPFTVVG